MKNALIIAQRQIVSPIRQKWIDDLRDLVSELISTAQIHWIYQKDTESAHTSLLLSCQKIELMLNPNEADHKELKVALERLIEVVLRGGKPSMRDYTDAVLQSTALAQAVFKREWERVKTED